MLQPGEQHDEHHHAVELTARGHRYRFVWTTGQERSVLQTVREMADDTSEALDWFDAALLAYELGRRCRTGIPAVSTSLSTTPPAPLTPKTARFNAHHTREI